MAKQPLQPFAPIAALPPAGKGDSPPGFHHVQDFLTRFGYLPPGGCQKGTLCPKTAEALGKYQGQHGLGKTEVFDQTTQKQMTRSRCALPDLNNGVAFTTMCRWPATQTQLTYAFGGGTGDVAGNGEFDAVRAAFVTWEPHLPLTFVEVDAGKNPDVLIDWRPANDPDLSMVGGTLAHADFPPGCSVVTNGLPKPVHFDDTEHLWFIGTAPGAFDVETVALHEIGHILGLAHSTVSGAVMFPSIGSNTTNRALQADDVAGIQNLYT